MYFLEDPRIIQEDRQKKENIQRITQETFGDGPQPKLEFAEYKVNDTYALEISFPPPLPNFGNLTVFLRCSV